MCGIAGIFSLNGKNFADAPSLHKMAMAMAHRGPDDEGYLIITDKEVKNI